MTLSDRWNDAGLLREYVAERFGSGLYFGMPWERFASARRICRRIAELTGQELDAVMAQAVKDWYAANDGEPRVQGRVYSGEED